MDYSSIFASSVVVVGALGIAYYHNKEKKTDKDNGWLGFYHNKNWVPRLDSVAKKWKFMHESKNKTYDFTCTIWGNK